MPLKIFNPEADARATDTGKLIHAAGDTGGLHGTATQKAIAAAMEDQITSANEPDKAGFSITWRRYLLDAPFVTIIGLYSNVEGSLDARGRNDQQNYLETQMKNADPKKKVLISVHHPPFSLDSAHGGTPDILSAIDRAISSSGRVPDLVLSGHVHNYQRFSRQLQNRQIPYVMAGAAGYADTERSMHKLQKGIEKEKLPYQTTQKDVKLQKFQQEQPGFLRITASQAQIDAEYWIVPFDGTAPSLFDHFTA